MTVEPQRREGTRGPDARGQTRGAWKPGGRGPSWSACAASGLRPAQRDPVVPSGAVCAWSLSLTLPQMTGRRLEGRSDSLRSQVAVPAAA